MRKKLFNILKKWARIPYCSYMCLRFPFLYPRNRFTDMHYNNWKILNFLTTLIKKYKKNVFLKDENEKEILNYSKEWHYKYISNRMCEYWINWWSKPLYYTIKYFHDYILQIFHCLPTSTEWDAVEKGWRKAFGNEYLKELKKQLIKDNMLYSWRITQIKEKWGRFQLYCNYGSDDLYKIIDKYEDLSWNICINCGKPSTHISVGWISPYCKECSEKEKHVNFLTKEEFEKIEI